MDVVDAVAQPQPWVRQRVQRDSWPLFDWIMVGASGWLLGGLYLDAWAHNHFDRLETFFTPWHAVLYSGVLAVTLVLLGATLRNHLRGLPWRQSIPAGYQPAFLGVWLFILGGLGDLVWHVLFGIEKDLDAAFSPTHLTIAFAAALILSGPFHAAWKRPDQPGGKSWIRQAPLLLSLGYTLSLVTLLTQYAHPFVTPWAAVGNEGSNPLNTKVLGALSVWLQTGVVMGLVLLSLRRWVLPLGSLTWLLTFNIVLLSFMQDHYILIIPAVLGGVIADALRAGLHPTLERPGALRLFAFFMPIGIYSCYFLTLVQTTGVWWSFHLSTGVIISAGIAGWLLSYLLLPPALLTPEKGE